MKSEVGIVGVKMAVKHINPKAKEESGLIVSGREAKKVVQILSDSNISKSQFIKSTKSFGEAIKIAKTLKI